MKAGMAVLKPLLTAGGDTSSRTGVLMMGTVRGDLHDIGKNLVCMMAEGAGFEVHDIGVDQSVEKFMAAADACKPDIIGMSALLTTTMTYMKTVIDGFQADGRTDVKFAIGGAPISQMFADEIGADGYGQDASSAVDLFLHFVGKGDAPTNAKNKVVAEAPSVDQAKAESATYQVLYWKDIPSQVKAWDENGETKTELAPRFAERIDAAAQKLGLTDEESYTAQYHWSEEQERAGSAAQVAAVVRGELEAESP
jgi:cobalamin-dependent methionine synthase I